MTIRLRPVYHDPVSGNHVQPPVVRSAETAASVRDAAFVIELFIRCFLIFDSILLLRIVRPVLLLQLVVTNVPVEILDREV